MLSPGCSSHAKEELVEKSCPAHAEGGGGASHVERNGHA